MNGCERAQYNEWFNKLCDFEVRYKLFLFSSKMIASPLRTNRDPGPSGIVLFGDADPCSGLFARR